MSHQITSIAKLKWLSFYVFFSLSKLNQQTIMVTILGFRFAGMAKKRADMIVDFKNE